MEVTKKRKKEGIIINDDVKFIIMMTEKNLIRQSD